MGRIACLFLIGALLTSCSTGSVGPAERASQVIPSPPMPVEPITATPSRASSTQQPAADLVGRFGGDAQLGADCAWLVNGNGDLWEIVPGSPTGYHFEFPGNDVLFVGPDGKVVAHNGDVIGMDGTFDPPEFGSFCMVGRVFQAHNLVFVTREESSTHAPPD